MLKRPRIDQALLHSCPTDAGGGLRRACSTPMRLQADGIVISGRLERAKLRGPIDIPFIDRRPYDLSCSVLNGVLAVAMVDTVLGQAVPASGEGVQLAAHHGVPGVPVQGKVWGLNGGQNFGG